MEEDRHHHRCWAAWVAIIGFACCFCGWVASTPSSLHRNIPTSLFLSISLASYHTHWLPCAGFLGCRDLWSLDWASLFHLLITWTKTPVSSLGISYGSIFIIYYSICTIILRTAHIVSQGKLANEVVVAISFISWKWLSPVRLPSPIRFCMLCSTDLSDSGTWTDLSVGSQFWKFDPIKIHCRSTPVLHELPPSTRGSIESSHRQPTEEGTESQIIS